MKATMRDYMVLEHKSERLVGSSVGEDVERLGRLSAARSA